MAYNTKAMAVMVTGISGQDGSYLAEQLLAAGQRVIGLIEPGVEIPGYLSGPGKHQDMELVNCDMSDPASLRLLVRSINPARIYHLAAISSPHAVQQDPVTSRAVNVTSVEVLLDHIKRTNPEARLLTVSSAWIFGEPKQEPQNETTPVNPVNEYSRQKLEVRDMSREARESGMFVACAIPFSHESPRRTDDFVFAKVCRAAARIASGEQAELVLGDQSAKRDWGYAPEYATAFAWMLDVSEPYELVLATGVARSVADLVKSAFDYAGVDHEKHVVSDPALMRGISTVAQVGDPARAWEELGWEATTTFEDLIKLMVDAEHQRIRSFRDG